MEWIHELSAALGDTRDGEMMGLSEKKKKKMLGLDSYRMWIYKTQSIDKYISTEAIIIWEECD